MNAAITAFWCATVALIGALQLMMPGLTRTDLLFAVTVAPGFRSEPLAREIVSRYRGTCGVIAALALGLAAFAARWQLAGIAALTLEIVAGALNFVRAHTATQAYGVAPRAIREADLAARNFAPLARVVCAAPAVVGVAVVIWMNLHLGRLPEPYPIHWGPTGLPDGFVARNHFNVTMFGGALVATALVLGVVAYAVFFGVRRIAIRGARGRAETFFRTLVGAMALGAAFSTTAMLLLPFGFSARKLIAVPFALTIVGATVAVAMGQGGARVAPAATGDGAPAGDLTPDDRWKWGLFYVNRDDPALIVEKRVGIGYTMNFGNRWSWALVALIVLVAIAPAAVPLRAMLTRAPATTAIGRERADELLAALRDHDFDRAERNFSGEMKSSLPPTRLGRVWADTTGELGALQSWSFVGGSTSGGLEARTYALRFTHGTMRSNVGIDPANGEVTGLWFFGPAPALAGPN